MNSQQILVFVILAVTLGLFAWGRLRYDLVALISLFAAICAQIVKPEDAFKGFADDIVIIVGSALVVSAGIGRSGIAEAVIAPIARYMRSSEMQVVVLAGTVAVLSAFMKNIGALAIFMPIAFQISKKSETPVSRLLMPMSFAALLGGNMTLIGTSPNIIASRERTEILGHPFQMFDFMPVGLALTLAGVAFLAFGWRLLPRSRQAAPTKEDRFQVEDYQSEAVVGPKSTVIGKTVGDLEEMSEGEVTVTGIQRGSHEYVPARHWHLSEGDSLMLQCNAHALARLVDKAKLELRHDKELAPQPQGESDDVVVEAVITPSSIMVGNTAEELRLRDRYRLNLLALSRHGQTPKGAIRRLRFDAGDLIVLRGHADEVMQRLSDLGCIPLAERNLEIGRRPPMWLAPSILTVAMIVAGSGTATVAIAFFGAAVLMVMTGAVRLDEAYQAIDWPILILLGGLIPVSESLRTSGDADLIANWLSQISQTLPPMGSLALILIAAMAVTPFLNNAATVLMMAPIGAGFADRLHLNADPFLIAVAVGAACDFLTPVGHQCNTLVMGPGGYRFGDYWKLGLPLSILVAVAGTFLIATFWPLQ